MTNRPKTRRVYFKRWRTMLVPMLVTVGACVQPAPQLASQSASGVTAETEKRETLELTRFGSFLAGKIARGSQDTASAAKYYDLALAADPDNAALIGRAFRSSLAEGRIERAVELAGRQLAVRPNAALARLVLAVDAFARNDAAAARNHLGKQQQSGFATLLRPIFHAWIDHSEGKYAAALAQLQPLEKQKTFDAFRGYHLGLMDDLAERAEAAGPAYVDAFKRGGGSSRIVYAYASFLSRHDQAEKAGKIVDDYLLKFSANPIARAANKTLLAGEPLPLIIETPQQGVSEAFFGIAASLNRDRSRNAARIYVHLALYLRPDMDAAQILLGEIHDSARQWRRANEVYGKIAEGSPFKWESRVRIADNLHRLENIDASLTLLRAMSAERPDNIDPLITIGDLLRGEKRYSEAITAYGQAIDRVAKPLTRHWALYYSRGIAYERSKQWQLAEADFLRALELRPEQPLVLNYLGYSWVELGQNLDRARGMIERAVKQRPNDGFIVDSLGWALYRLGDYQSAVKHLERAIELKPEDPILNDHLGDAYWRVGRQAEARFQWQHALVFKPDAAVMAAIESKLKSGLGPAEPIEN